MPGGRHQIILRGQGQQEETSEDSSDNEDDVANQTFDTQLPTQHSVSTKT